MLITDRPCPACVPPPPPPVPAAVGDYVLDLPHDRTGTVVDQHPDGRLEIEDADGAHFHCPPDEVYVIEKAVLP